MTAKFSTGLRTTMLGATGFTGIFDTARMRIYSGAPPATADAAATGTLLIEISGPAGVDLAFGVPAAGVVSKDSGQAWEGDVLADGTCGYYRLVNDADDGTESTTAPRVQGSIAAAGADLNMTNPTVVELDTQPINNFAVALPTL